MRGVVSCIKGISRSHVKRVDYQLEVRVIGASVMQDEVGPCPVSTLLVRPSWFVQFFRVFEFAFDLPCEPLTWVRVEHVGPRDFGGQKLRGCLSGLRHGYFDASGAFGKGGRCLGHEAFFPCFTITRQLC